MIAAMFDVLGTAQVIFWAMVGAGALIVVFILNALFRILVNRYGARPDDYPHRTGTQLPREPK